MRGKKKVFCDCKAESEVPYYQFAKSMNYSWKMKWKQKVEVKVKVILWS